MRNEKDFQDKFQFLITEIMAHSSEVTPFESLIGLVSSIITDAKTDHLLMVIRLHFPEYFTDYKPFRL